MGQAKVLTDRELKKILLYISARSHATRNRCMFLLTHGSGMRVGEVAALRICDVLLKDGNIKDEIRLSAEQTKGDRARTVVLSDRMQSEIRNYLCSRFKLNDLLAVTLTDTTRALFTIGIRERMLKVPVTAVDAGSLPIWRTKVFQCMC